MVKPLLSLKETEKAIALGFLTGWVGIVLSELENSQTYPAMCPESYVRMLRKSLQTYETARDEHLEEIRANLVVLLKD